MFSWEQKGFQDGEPNRIHYLTISSKLMQDCAGPTCSMEGGLDSLRWAGSEAPISVGSRGTPSSPVCLSVLSSEHSQHPTLEPIPISANPDSAFIHPSTLHPVQDRYGLPDPCTHRLAHQSHLLQHTGLLLTLQLWMPQDEAPHILTERTVNSV